MYGGNQEKAEAGPVCPERGVKMVTRVSRKNYPRQPETLVEGTGKLSTDAGRGEDAVKQPDRKKGGKKGASRESREIPQVAREQLRSRKKQKPRGLGKAQRQEEHRGKKKKTPPKPKPTPTKRSHFTGE